MRWPPWRRARRPPHRCRGVRLRISVPAGPLVEADSESLYVMAKYGGADTVCLAGCPPRCDRHGWYELLAGVGEHSIVGGSMIVTGLRTDLRIEIKPWLGAPGA